MAVHSPSRTWTCVAKACLIDSRGGNLRVLRGDVERHHVAGDLRLHKEPAERFVVRRLLRAGPVAARASHPVSKHERDRRAHDHIRATAFEDAQRLLGAACRRRHAIAHVDVGAAVTAARRDRHGPVGVALLRAAFLDQVLADADLQLTRRPVERRQHLADLRRVGARRAQEQLVALAGQRAAGLDQRLQHRQHLVGRAEAQVDDLDGLCDRRRKRSGREKPERATAPHAASL